MEFDYVMSYSVNQKYCGETNRTNLVFRIRLYCGGYQLPQVISFLKLDIHIVGVTNSYQLFLEPSHITNLFCGIRYKGFEKLQQKCSWRM